MRCAKIGRECDPKRHETSYAESWLFRESTTGIPKWSSDNSRGGDREPEPRGAETRPRRDSGPNPPATP